jgi:hypothetical protein
VQQKGTKQTVLKSEAELSFEELAARQGIQPATDFDALLGHPSAEDESTEEFAAMLREWRREGSGSARTR